MARDRTTNTGTWERGGPLTAPILLDMLCRAYSDTVRYQREHDRAVTRHAKELDALQTRQRLELEKINQYAAETLELANGYRAALRRFPLPPANTIGPRLRAFIKGTCIPACTLDKANQ